jgi:LuxR family maltose regulon positive regulatory protein
LWLAQGNLARAEAWAQSCNLPLDEKFNYDLYPGEYAALVRIFIAQEQFTKALALLQRMEAAAKMAGRSGRLIEILMLQALTWYGQGDPDQALPPLSHALSLGEQGGYVRTFADEGGHIVPLLHLTKSRRLASEAYIDKLLAALRAEEQESKRAGEMLGSPTPLLVESLSERELEVLRLVAAGLSNQEIAEKLVIAEGTVKKHLHNVFGKLNARSRTQALLRAAELDLL